VSLDRAGARSTDPSNNEALIEKYGAVAYATQSNAQSHPERLATVASLHGLSPPPVATCRVLEVGCGDGENLLSMAAGLPDASFVGCDLSPQAIATGREAILATDCCGASSPALRCKRTVPSITTTLASRTIRSMIRQRAGNASQAMCENSADSDS
jgi:SAM-dependent methyltransferase